MRYAQRIILVLLVVFSWASCSDDDSFSSSADMRLTFSIDSVTVDTIFSRVPSSTRTFWVYNNGKSGIRCQNVRLAKGNQTGFRVNVDGIYLGASEGWQTSDIEIRRGDSIRVFVEATTPLTGKDFPQRITDYLVFTLESGVEQQMPLTAWSWDALLLNRLHVSRDTTIATTRPVVVYGPLTVDSMATLRILGSTIYFHSDAGIDVYGRLITDSLGGRETVLRGDRLDHMFDYLPYDRVSGQWKGVHFRSSSFGNELRHTDLHSASDGVVCDSASCDSTRSRLLVESSTIHNCQGYGLQAVHSNITILNSQISNTLNACLDIHGGYLRVVHSTFAQFYPFDAARGKALFLSNLSGLEAVDLSASIVNSLVTGYADDEVGGERDTSARFDYCFEHCLLRTSAVTDADSVCYVGVIFEASGDTATLGKRHFVCIDEDNLIYDFRLKAMSPAVGAADPLSALPADRYGIRRDEHPDIGAYEHTP